MGLETSAAGEFPAPRSGSIAAASSATGALTAAAPAAATNAPAAAFTPVEREGHAGRERPRAADPVRLRARAGDTAHERPGWPGRPGRPYWLGPLLTLIILSIGLGTLGFAAYQVAKDSVTRAVAANLESVAKLKSLQINHWLENAAGELKTTIDAPQFAQALQDWEIDGRRDGERRAQLEELVRRIATNSHYVEIDLRSAQDGSLLLASRNNPTPTDAERSLAAVGANAPVLDGFHAGRGDSGERVRVGYFYPCRARGSTRTLAVVHVELDPTDMLAQLAQEWPSLSYSAETILLRRDGDDVVFVTRVRDLPGARSMMRMPLSRSESVAAQAVTGGSGYISGPDYTNDAVLAFALQIDETPWFILAQIDQAEVYGKIHAIAALAGLAVSALLVLGCGWWAMRRRFLIARRYSELELSKLQTERADNLQRIAETSRRVVNVQEMERRHLSGELHDLIGANLAAIDMILATYARSVPVADSPGRDSLLRDSRDLLAETIARVREFSVELRPVVLDAAGVVPALKECGVRFTRRTGIPFEFIHEEFSGRLSTQLESVVYRIAQEALTNCAKHANALRVMARLSLVGRRLELSIADDGAGFEPDALEGQANRSGGLGLITMRERAEFVGGKLFVTSRPGAGTEVRLVFEDVAQV